MAMDDEKFRSVPLNSLEPNECSPRPADFFFRGILLNAPQQVAFKKGEYIGPRRAFAGIPICGYYMLAATSIPQGHDVLSSICLMARNIKTGKEYSGMIRDPDPQPPPPTDVPQPSPEDLAGLSVGGYFNPNLVDYVPIPAEPGIYEVHAEVGDIKSNTVTIELVQK